MGLLFNSKKHLSDADPRKPLTRYKQVHVRKAPAPAVEGMIDPLEGHTRMEARHVRKAVQQAPRFSQRTTPKANPASDLHSNDPISIDVLRRALPLRASALD